MPNDYSERVASEARRNSVPTEWIHTGMEAFHGRRTGMRRGASAGKEGESSRVIDGVSGASKFKARAAARFDSESGYIADPGRRSTDGWGTLTRRWAKHKRPCFMGGMGREVVTPWEKD